MQIRTGCPTNCPHICGDKCITNECKRNFSTTIVVDDTPTIEDRRPDMPDRIDCTTFADELNLARRFSVRQNDGTYKTEIMVSGTKYTEEEYNKIFYPTGIEPITNEYSPRDFVRWVRMNYDKPTYKLVESLVEKYDKEKEDEYADD